MAPVVSVVNIVKQFPGVLANDHISFEIEEGEIHGLLGENGAGKTTLMNILSGLSQPDAGQILLRGQPVHFNNCNEAIAGGIGMVHQHFMLVPVFTVAENIILANEPTAGLQIDMRQAVSRVKELSDCFGLKADPTALVRDIPVGMQQRVEILKALSRGANILILDEPTAVLTPQEVRELYAVMHSLREHGHTIIFITHKLREIKEITDRVTVLRDGRVVNTVATDQVDEPALARMMVGRDVILHIQKQPAHPGAPALRVAGVSALSSRGLPAVKNASFEVRAGEVVGIAGVAGNGQTELVEALTGLRQIAAGQIYLDGKEITNEGTRQRLDEGLAHIPEDRQRRGLVMDFSLTENLVLGFEDSAPFRQGPLLNYQAAEEFANKVMGQFDVRAPGAQVLARTLSGGNQQKAILAREFQRQPRVLIACQPTRGLDVAATEFVHTQLIRLRDEGKAVLLVSMELTEILDLSDRILVMFEGEIVGVFQAGEASAEELGLLMAGSRSKRNDGSALGAPLGKEVLRHE
ncbi:MAG: ABC transporter ATP-binding protein [Chloroflexi bacterium]|nr:ABC transporter ATP-binding protein [Chloroflexota bacterium]